MKDFEDWVKLIITVIILISFIPVLFSALNYSKELANQPYIQQLQQKDTEIQKLKLDIQRLKDEIANWERRYYELRNETITKEDIEIIKMKINETQNQINYLAQQFEIVNQNFITAYNTYFTVFYFSFIFNFILAFYIVIDFLSVALGNVSISVRVVNRIRKIVKKS